MCYTGPVNKSFSPCFFIYSRGTIILVITLPSNIAGQVHIL